MIIYYLIIMDDSAVFSFSLLFCVMIMREKNYFSESHFFAQQMFMFFSYSLQNYLPTCTNRFQRYYTLCTSIFLLRIDRDDLIHINDN